MLIDFHTHAFPPAIAERALAGLATRSNLTPVTDGTVPGLIDKLDTWHINRAVICNIATNPKQTANVNNFAIATMEEYGSQVTPLGSIHPAFISPEEEIVRLHRAGIPGLKIHPDYMEYAIDDPAFDVIFDTAASLGMFIITHAGFDVYSPHKIWATPNGILNRIRRSPRTTFICAHFGGLTLWDEVEATLMGQPIYIDTSMGFFGKLSKEQATRMLKKHDSSRILFGSDCPWSTSAATLEYVDSLALSDDVKEQIYSENARHLLGL